MKEENRKRINKLIIPFTRRTLSLLTTATILATGTVGCKNKDKVKDNNSLTSSIPDDEVNTNEESINFEDYDESNTNEELSTNNEANNDNSSKNDNKGNSSNNSSNKNNQTNNNNSNKNNQANNNSSNKNNQSSNSSTNNNQNSSNNSNNSSKPSTTTPSVTPPTSIKPTMPSTLTASNINDVEVFKHFAEEFRQSANPGAINTTYHCSYDGVDYITQGIEEYKINLIVLNYKYINSNLLNELIDGYSEYELKKQASFIDQITYVVGQYNSNFDFSSLCIDKNLGKFLNEFTNEYQKSYQGGKSSNFENMVNKYFRTKDSTYYYGNSNAWVDYYIWSLASLGRDFINDMSLRILYQQIYSYEDYTNYVDNILNDVKGKVKIYN